MRREITVTQVRSFSTQRGSVRWVLKDDDGNEYTTFREAIGEHLAELEGERARIEFHQERRGQYTNVYLDSIEPAGGGHADPGAPPDTDPEEAAWQTAVAAAPWLVGEPGPAVPPKKLYDKLKPFEQYVADDIEERQQARDSGEGEAG